MRFALTLTLLALAPVGFAATLMAQKCIRPWVRRNRRCAMPS